MAYLLDTNIVIHLRERNALVIGKFQQLTEPPLISVATQVELEGGVYVDPDISDRRREAVDALLALFPVIDFDAEMAAAYGAIILRVGFNRRKIIDRMIAATALVKGLTPITSNADDFTDIDNLGVETWTS